MLMILLNSSILHLTIVCYQLITLYVLVDNKNDYIVSYNIYNNYDQFKMLIKTNIKLVLNKELLFRIYLVELMKYFLNEEDLIICWMFIFSSFNIYYHTYSQNILNISNFIKIFIISYFLINTTIIGSVLIHLYSEMIGIMIQKYLFNIYKYKPYDNKKESDIITLNKLTNMINPKIELASKEDVEKLLSTKKIE
jgi:hypothetical protein